MHKNSPAILLKTAVPFYLKHSAQEMLHKTLLIHIRVYINERSALGVRIGLPFFHFF